MHYDAQSTAGRRSRSQALLVASTRPGKDANVSTWSRARRIRVWMSRARSHVTGAARISSSAASSLRRLDLIVEAARLPIPREGRAEPQLEAERDRVVAGFERIGDGARQMRQAGLLPIRMTLLGGVRSDSHTAGRCPPMISRTTEPARVG